MIKYNFIWLAQLFAFRMSVSYLTARQDKACTQSVQELLKIGFQYKCFATSLHV